MQKVDLKRGLFGYTHSSVEEYITALTADLAARTDNLAAENEQLRKRCGLYEDEISASGAKQDELLDKISALSKEAETYAADKAQLVKQIDELKSALAQTAAENLSYNRGQSDLADVMLEAKRFANDLKRKTEIEFEQKQAENDERIKTQRERIEKYISDIDELTAVLRKFCDDFGEDIGKERAKLSVIHNNITELNAKNG